MNLAKRVLTALVPARLAICKIQPCRLRRVLQRREFGLDARGPGGMVEAYRVEQFVDRGAAAEYQHVARTAQLQAEAQRVTHVDLAVQPREIGRASCRERVF